MGHDSAPQTAALQKKNLAAFDAWVKNNGKVILPIPGRAVIYAGYPRAELVKAQAFLTANEPCRRMWQIIEFAEKNFHEYTGQVRYDKLNDVLKRIRSPLPALVETNGANIGDPKKFADLLDCVSKLTDPKWALIDKGKFNYVWDTLSTQYVSNSKGEVEIWQGCKANHKQVDVSTTLIRAELTALLARTDLPVATREAASKIVVSYVRHHQAQKIYSEKVVREAEAFLRGARGG